MPRTTVYLRPYRRAQDVLLTYCAGCFGAGLVLSFRLGDSIARNAVWWAFGLIVGRIGFRFGSRRATTNVEPTVAPKNASIEGSAWTWVALIKSTWPTLAVAVVIGALWLPDVAAIAGGASLVVVLAGIPRVRRTKAWERGRNAELLLAVDSPGCSLSALTDLVYRDRTQAQE